MTETSPTGAAGAWRIGIDVGGTFTDFVAADGFGGELVFHKEPSIPADPSLAVERGLATLMAAHGIGPDDIGLVVHGTTIGLNAIIQRRGARMALVVSRGNRDLLEIARLRMPSSYDVTVSREVPLVPRDLVFEVDARMRSDGTVLQAPGKAELDALAVRLHAAGVEAVAVVLLNSYRDPALEEQVADALRARLPDLPVTTSGTVWPEIREYERGTVAGLNAFIQPMMSAYFDRLGARTAGLGVAAPVYITANNGGTLSLPTARARPIDTVLSGPASGVVASLRVGEAANRTQLVTFDMGGTSADMSVCQTGTPEFTTQTFVGDFPLIMPVVNVGAIGAGGGSVVSVDAQGVLKVGPHSAGADPGPACYNRGGTAPTLTDCYLALGILDPGGFLGGRMALDAAAAHAALDAVAVRAGLPGSVAAAEAAVRVASARMATEVTKLLAAAGVDPRAFALVAYGGAGPTHGNLLAEEAQLTTVLVPAAPGTFCALGALLADVRRDYVRTLRTRLGTPDSWPAITAALRGLEDEARAWVAAEGSAVGEVGIAISFDMRYAAQAYELRIAVPAALRPAPDPAGLAELFHAEHERLYGFREPDAPVETATVRLAAIGRVQPVRLANAPGRPPPVPRAHRTVWHGGRPMSAAVYDRAAFGAGASAPGPAVIEQPDTTTLVLPGWRAAADRIGTLHLSRQDARENP